MRRWHQQAVTPHCIHLYLVKIFNLGLLDIDIDVSCEAVTLEIVIVRVVGVVRL